VGDEQRQGADRRPKETSVIETRRTNINGEKLSRAGNVLPKERQGRCPDGGKCHHECKGGYCWRVKTCGPLSGVYPNDEWPPSVKKAHSCVCHDGEEHCPLHGRNMTKPAHHKKTTTRRYRAPDGALVDIEVEPGYEASLDEGLAADGWRSCTCDAGDVSLPEGWYELWDDEVIEHDDGWLCEDGCAHDSPHWVTDGEDVLDRGIDIDVVGRTPEQVRREPDHIGRRFIRKVKKPPKNGLWRLLDKEEADKHTDKPTFYVQQIHDHNPKTDPWYFKLCGVCASDFGSCHHTRCRCTERDDLRTRPCPLHDASDGPKWTKEDSRAMEHRDATTPHPGAKHPNCSGDPHAEDWCGGVFRCGGCGEWVGWCFGADTDMPAACDDCWAAAHDKNEGEVMYRCSVCADPFTVDEGIEKVDGGWVCSGCKT
jgi:hypothetical protein